MKRLAWIVAMVALAPASTAFAQDVSQSKAVFKSCKLVKKGGPKDGGNWSLWQCSGKFGYLVRMEDFDDRMSISVGRTMKQAAAEPAAKLDTSRFNEAGDDIEWRSRRGKPYAIIQRWWFRGFQKPDAQFLIVTRLPPGPVCRVALVRVESNPNHQAIARKIADTKATSFRCDGPVVTIGAGGVEEAAVP